MITAIDTNILLDIVAPNREFVEASIGVLEEAARSGSLVICDIVYAELSVAFPTQRACDAFLEQNEIRVESLSHAASFLASRLWRNYRRRGGKRNRILPDFLIGAHARLQATRLLSRDRGFYRDMFPPLVVVDPAAPRT